MTASHDHSAACAGARIHPGPADRRSLRAWPAAPDFAGLRARRAQRRRPLRLPRPAEIAQRGGDRRPVRVLRSATPRTSSWWRPRSTRSSGRLPPALTDSRSGRSGSAPAGSLLGRQAGADAGDSSRWSRPARPALHGLPTEGDDGSHPRHLGGYEQPSATTHSVTWPKPGAGTPCRGAPRGPATSLTSTLGAAQQALTSRASPEELLAALRGQ